MKKGLLILISCCLFIIAGAQEIPETSEQKLENLTDNLETETEDDSYLQDLEKFRKNPVNLNSADADELRELKILSGLQIARLLTYRNLLGNFISIYELQAIPSWDLATIRKLLPYVTINIPFSLKEYLGTRFQNGNHIMLFRFSQVMEKSTGFDHSTSGTKYLGSPQKLFFRYRYSYKNLLQYGLIADKDAGEQLFKGIQNKGFDFYSFHLFARKIGIIQSLALGDFTVNMGQGLIQWQSLAFKKSVDVIGIKRQSAVLRPYNSAGEIYFHRGAGITLRKEKTELTVFASVRKLSANFVTDTISNEDFVSSILTSGYHRTISEAADRNNLRQTVFGGSIKYRTDRLQIGINAINYQFSLPVHKRDEPYNLFAINGRQWHNLSVDYSYTFKNVHFFGEAAADKKSNTAFINGMMVSVDPRVDLSLLQRTINKEYQSINGYAFTENTYPVNETGWYAGISIRPVMSLRLDAYADFYKFPWLKYLVDAPSSGNDFLVQATYSPNKQVEFYIRYRNETKQGNQSDNNTVTNYLVKLPKQNLRTQLQLKVRPDFSLRNRVELVWYDRDGMNKSNGFLTYIDFIYKPVMKPFSCNLRLQYFETDDYNSRLYAYENDVLYSFSIPVFYEKGYRYYLNMNYDISSKISFWLRWAQTIYPNRNTIGTGLDEIRGKKKSELKAQALIIL